MEFLLREIKEIKENIMCRGEEWGEEMFSRRDGLGHKWIRRKKRCRRWKNIKNGNPDKAVEWKRKELVSCSINTEGFKAPIAGAAHKRSFPEFCLHM